MISLPIIEGRILQPENLWDVFQIWFISKLFPGRKRCIAGVFKVAVKIRNKKINILKLNIPIITERVK